MQYCQLSADVTMVYIFFKYNFYYNYTDYSNNSSARLSESWMTMKEVQSAGQVVPHPAPRPPQLAPPPHNALLHLRHPLSRPILLIPWHPRCILVCFCLLSDRLVLVLSVDWKLRIWSDLAYGFSTSLWSFHSGTFNQRTMKKRSTIHFYRLVDWRSYESRTSLLFTSGLKLITYSWVGILAAALPSKAVYHSSYRK